MPRHWVPFNLSALTCNQRANQKFGKLRVARLLHGCCRTVQVRLPRNGDQTLNTKHPVEFFNHTPFLGNQIGSSQPSAHQQALTDIDCAPPRKITELQDENRRLNLLIETLSTQNTALIAKLDNQYPSPSEKKFILETLLRTHSISRRRACRLLNLARSTCWYRTSSNTYFSWKADVVFSALSDAALIQRLKGVRKQVKLGYSPKDHFTRVMIENALRRLGLGRAASLASRNLNLSMEFFSVYLQQKEQLNDRNRQSQSRS